MKTNITDGMIGNPVIRILEELSKVRQAALQKKVFSPEEKDHYLGLTQELFEKLNENPNESLIDAMRVVVNRLPKRAELMRYDPLQDGYWLDTENRFVQALDDILIGITREEFCSIDEKHHIVQALKQVNLSKRPWAEQKAVLDGIAPFYGALPLEDTRGFGKLVGWILGSSIEQRALDAVTLRLDNIQYAMFDRVVDIARKRGFLQVQVDIDDDEVYEELSKKYGKDNALTIIDKRGYHEKTICINLRPGYVQTRQASPYAKLTEIASLRLPEDVTNSLVFSPARYNTYGRVFDREVRKAIPQLVDGMTPVPVPEHSAMVYQHEVHVGQYVRDALLVCQPDRRSLVTLIRQGDKLESLVTPVAEACSRKLSAEDTVQVLKREVVHHSEKVKYALVKNFAAGKFDDQHEVFA
ncbi:MAG: hypothetical protein Q7R96_04810 [Nanoarchaeota archaeon]|nr:hypothetical protein [Nanoarchaeota archaeon]